MSSFPVRSVRGNGEVLKQAFLVWRSPPDFPLCLHDAMCCSITSISDVLLTTNVLSLIGGYAIQAKTMVESHYACTYMFLC